MGGIARRGASWRIMGGASTLAVALFLQIGVNYSNDYSDGVRGTDEFRVGVHIKSLRESMDPFPVLEVLDETLAGLPGAVLQVNGHHDVLDADGARRHDALRRRRGRRGGR